MQKNLNQFFKNLVGKNQCFDVLQDLQLSTELTENETEQRFINLQIKLNDWSPVYEANGYRYKEKIAIDCFDKTTPISEQNLFSYVDHKISIKNLIGSTNDNTMQVTKKDNVIYAKIRVNEEDYLSKKTADLINSGAIKSNSFIFKAEDVDYVWYDENTKKDVDFEIIFKSGKLISIDPVFQGFYPQNQMSISKSINSIFEKQNFIEEILKMKNETMEQKELVSETNNDINIVEKEVTENDNVISEQTSNSVNEPEPEISEPEAQVEQKEQLTKTEKELLEIKKELDFIKETREAMSTPKFVNETQQVEVLDFKTIQTKYLNRQVLTKAEADVLLKNSLPLNPDYALKENLRLELNAKSYEDYYNTLQERALNGTSTINGLALAEVLQNNRVLSEWMLIFPELTTYAQIIPLVGFNKIEQSIAIADNTAITKLAEDTEALTYNLGVAKVTLEADRYSLQFKQNNQLNKFETMLAITTNNVKNKIIQALRADFFTNLFAKVGEAFNKDNYDGGARKEAVVYTKEVGKFTFKDLNNIATKLIEKYGDEVLNKYFISMSSDIYNHLATEYYTSGNTLWKGIFDETGRTFRGIPIILSDKIPDKTVEVGKNIVAFLTKDSIIAYGCVTTIRDSAENFLTTDQYLRVVQTRGRVRMCDPNINTIILQVRENASQISSKKLNETEKNLIRAEKE